MSSPSIRQPLRTVWLWLAFAIIAALATALLPLLWNSKHYFVDDSVNGAFGQWYHLGQSLLAGRIPLLEPTAWSSGNLVAEGQWGFANPLVVLIAVLSTFASDAAVFTTVVKVCAILIGAAGVFFLALQAGARAQFAAVAAAVAPFTGFTTYFDAPSWVTGLFAWALMPWFWALLLRLRADIGSPIAAFVAGYLIISIGYVHGTLALVIILATTLALQALRRDWRGAIRVVALGAMLGLVALAVHLTSVLTAPVTNRGGNAIYMDQFMALDLSGLVMSPVSTALPQVAAWWWTGFTSPVPLVYVTCLLPLLAFVRWRDLLRTHRPAVEILATGAAFLTFILLPTVIGPLRYPTRMLPYVALCAIVLLVVGLERSFAISRARLWAAASLLAAPAFLAWAQYPQIGKRIAVATLIGTAAVAVFVLLRRRQAVGRLAVALIALSVLAFSLQQWIYPRSIWAEQYVPTDVSELQTQLEESEGDTIVVGNPLDVGDPALWNETLFANTWYVNPHAVVNRYQLLGFRGFNDTVCLGYLGETCPELAERLFETRPDTGLTLADELAVSSVQIVKTESTERYLDAPPAGWHVAEDAKYTQLWVRNSAIPGAGGVISAGDATISDVRIEPETASFHVTHDGDTPTRIILSRLAWPGYTAAGATLVDPADGFLLAVEVPAGFDGDVSVSFRPAGQTVGVIALTVAFLAAVGWTVVAALRRRVTPSRATPDTMEA